MKYIRKLPSTDNNLSKVLISNGWKKIKEPSNLNLAILYSIPFMFINSIIFMGIALYIYPSLKEYLNSIDNFNITLSINLTIIPYILTMLLFISLHEFLHACFIPNFLKSDKIYWGINGMFAFVYTTEEIKKERYILISIMPFILLSIVLPILLSIFKLLNGFTLFLCFFNAMGSSVDILYIIIILTQVPNGSYIINNGFETYYK